MEYMIMKAEMDVALKVAIAQTQLDKYQIHIYNQDMKIIHVKT